MQALREKLKKRGAQGIRGLARNFKICDRDGSRSLDVQELAKCCSMCKLGLSLEEVRTLHGFFDRGGDGYISFDEFLKAIRGKLSPMRRKLVTKVFLPPLRPPTPFLLPTTHAHTYPHPPSVLGQAHPSVLFSHSPHARGPPLLVTKGASTPQTVTQLTRPSTRSTPRAIRTATSRSRTCSTPTRRTSTPRSRPAGVRRRRCLDLLALSCHDTTYCGTTY